MSDYVFPFDNLDFVNEVFSDYQLPFEHYANLWSLQPEEVDSHPFNESDLVDHAILPSNLPSCEYINPHEYVVNSGKPNLSIFHLNINCIPEHFEEFQSTFLGENGPHIIVINSIIKLVLFRLI